VTRWTDADIANLALRRIGGNVTPAKPSKYRNAPTVVDGKRFASKKEANYYLQLKLALAMNQIRGFACQVSIPLPSGKRRMVIDFMVVELDGRVRWVDTKGHATDTWKTKRDELEHALGIKIETV